VFLTLDEQKSETQPVDSFLCLFPSHALPAERLRSAARLFCQGSSLRSDERKLRGLDSADGEAPGPARKGICFLCTAPRCLKSKNQTLRRRTNPMQETTKTPLFPLGQIVATPGALAALGKAGQTPLEFLTRHVRGDWGELCEEDRKENQLSLEHGFRLLSSYRISSGDTKVWVITEADRSVTTLLLPEEY